MSSFAVSSSATSHRGSRSGGVSPRGAISSQPYFSTTTTAHARNMAAGGGMTFDAMPVECPISTSHFFPANIRSLDVVVTGEGAAAIAWCAEADGSIRIRSVPTGQEVLVLERKPKTFVTALVLVEAHVWAALSDGFLRMYDAIGCTMQHETVQHDGAVYCMTYTGLAVFTGGADWKIYEWDPESFEYGRCFAAHSNGVRSLAFAGANTLYSGSDDGMIKTWDVSPMAGSGQDAIATLRGHGGRSVLTMAVATRGTRLWTGGEDGFVRVWDVTTMQLVAEMERHNGPVTHLMHDEGKIWSCGKDGRVYVWSTHTNQCIHTLPDGMQVSSKYLTRMCKVMQTRVWKIWCCGSDGSVTCFNSETRLGGADAQRSGSLAATPDQDKVIAALHTALRREVDRVKELEESASYGDERVQHMKQLEALRDRITEQQEKEIVADGQLRQANERIEMSESLMTEAKKRLRDVQQELDVAHRECAKLRREAIDAHEASHQEKEQLKITADEASQTLAQALLENGDLRAALEQSTSVNQQLRRTIGARDDRIAALERELQDTLQQTANTQAAARSLSPVPRDDVPTPSVTMVEEDTGALRSRIAELEGLVETLRTEVSEHSVRAMEATATSSVARSASVDPLLASTDSADKALIGRLEREVSRLLTRVQDVEREADENFQKLQESESRRQEAEWDAQREHRDLQQQLEAARAVAARLPGGGGGARGRTPSPVSLSFVDEDRETELRTLRRSVDTWEREAATWRERSQRIQKDLDNALHRAQTAQQKNKVLEGQLAQLQSEAEGNPAADSAHSMVDQLQLDIEQHALEERRLRKDIGLLQQKVQDEESRTAQARTEMHEAVAAATEKGRREIETLNQKLSDVSFRLQTTEGDLDALRAQHSKLQRDHDNVQQKLRREADRCRQSETELADMTEKLETQEASARRESDALHSRLRTETARAQVLDRELEEAQTTIQKLDQDAAAVLRLQKENEALRSRLARETERVQSIESKVDDDVRAHRDEMESMRSQLRNCTQKYQSLESEHAHILSQHRDDANDWETRVEKLKSQNNTLQQRLRTETERANEASSALTRALDEASEVEGLQQRHADAAEHRLRTEQAKISALEAELDELHEIRLSNERLSRREQQLGGELQLVNEKLKSERDEVAVLRDRVAGLEQQQAQSQDVGRLRGEVDVLQAKLRTALSRADELEAELEKSNTTGAAHDREQQSKAETVETKLRKELELTQSKLRLEAQRADSAEIELGTLRHDVELSESRHKKDLDAAAVKLKSERMKLDFVEKELQEARARLEVVEPEIMGMPALRKEVEMLRSRLTAEVSRAETAETHKDDLVVQLETHQNAARREMDDLKSRLRRETVRAQALEQEIENLRALDGVRNEISETALVAPDIRATTEEALRSRVASEVQRADTAETQLQELTLEHERVRRESEAMASKLRAETAKLAVAEESTAELLQRLDDAEREALSLAPLKKDVELLRTRLKTETARAVAAESRSDEALAENEQLQSKLRLEAGKVQALTQSLASLKALLQDPQQQQQTAGAPDDSTLHPEVDIKKDMIRDLRVRVNNETQRADQAELQLQEMQSQLDRAQREVESGVSKLKAETNKVAAAEGDLKEARGRLESLEADAQRVVALRKDLDLQRSKFKAEVARADGAEARADELAEQLHSTQGQLRRAQQQQQQQQRRQRSATSSVQGDGDLFDTAQSAQSRAARSMTSTTGGDDGAFATADDNDEEVIALQIQLEKQIAAVNRFRGQLKQEKERASFQEQHALDLERELESARRDCDAAKRRLQASDARVHVLEGELATAFSQSQEAVQKLDAAHVKARQEARASEDTRRSMEDLQDRYEHLVQTREREAQLIQMLRDKVRETENSSTENTNNNKNDKNDISNVEGGTDNLAAAQRRSNELEEQVRSLQESTQDAVTAMQIAVAKANRECERAAEQQRRAREFEDAASAANACVKVLEEEMKSLRAGQDAVNLSRVTREEQVSTDMATLQHENDTLRGQLTEATTEISTLKTKLKKEFERSSQLEDDLGAAKLENSKLKAVLEVKLSAARNECEDLRRGAADEDSALRREKSALKQQLDDLTAQLQQQEEAHRKQVNDLQRRIVEMSSAAPAPAPAPAPAAIEVDDSERRVTRSAAPEAAPATAGRGTPPPSESQELLDIKVKLFESSERHNAEVERLTADLGIQRQRAIKEAEKTSVAERKLVEQMETIKELSVELGVLQRDLNLIPELINCIESMTEQHSLNGGITKSILSAKDETIESLMLEVAKLSLGAPSCSSRAGTGGNANVNEVVASKQREIQAQQGIILSLKERVTALEARAAATTESDPHMTVDQEELYGLNEDNLALRSRIDTLTSDLEASLQREASLKQVLREEESRRILNNEQGVETLRLSLDEARRHSSDLQDVVRSQETVIENLRKQLNSGDIAIAQESQSAANQSKIVTTLKQIVEERNKSIALLREVIDQRGKSISDLETRCNRLEASLLDETARYSRLENELRAAQRQLRDHELATSAQVGLVKERGELLDKARSDLHEKRLECDRLRRDLELTSSEKDRLEAGFAKARSMELQLVERESEIDTLREEIEQVRQEREVAEKRILELLEDAEALATARIQIVSLEADAEKMKSQLSEMQPHRDSVVKSLKDANEELRVQNRSLGADLTETKQELQHLSGVAQLLEDAREELRLSLTEHRTAERENERLTEELKSVQHEFEMFRARAGDADTVARAKELEVTLQQQADALTQSETTLIRFEQERDVATKMQRIIEGQLAEHRRLLATVSVEGLVSIAKGSTGYTAEPVMELPEGVTATDSAEAAALLQTLLQVVEEKSQEISRLDAELRRAMQSVGRLEGYDRNAQEELSELRQRLRLLEQRHAEKGGRGCTYADALAAIIRSKNDVLAALISDLRVKSELLDGAEQRVSDLVNQLDAAAGTAPNYTFKSLNKNFQAGGGGRVTGRSATPRTATPRTEAASAPNVPALNVEVASLRTENRALRSRVRELNSELEVFKEQDMLVEGETQTTPRDPRTPRDAAAPTTPRVPLQDILDERNASLAELRSELDRCDGELRQKEDIIEALQEQLVDAQRMLIATSRRASHAAARRLNDVDKEMGSAEAGEPVRVGVEEQPTVTRAPRRSTPPVTVSKSVSPTAAAAASAAPVFAAGHEVEEEDDDWSDVSTFAVQQRESRRQAEQLAAQVKQGDNVVRDLQMQLARLEEQSENKSKTIELLQRMIDEQKDSRINGNEALVQELREHNLLVARDVDWVARELSERQETIRQKDQIIMELQNARKQNAQEIATLSAKIMMAEQREQFEKDQREGLEHELQRSQGRAQELQDKITEVRSELEHKDGELATVRGELSKQQQYMQRQNEMLSELGFADLMEVSRRLQEYHDQLTGVVEEKDRLARFIHEQESAISSLELQLDNAAREHDVSRQVQEEHARVSEDMAELESTLRIVTLEKETAEEELCQTRNKFNELVEDFDLLKALNDEITASLDLTRAALTERDQTIDELRQALQAAEEKAQTTSQSLPEREAELQRRDNMISDLQNKLHDSTRRHNEAFEALENETRDVSERARELEVQLQNAEDDKHRLQAQCQTHEVNVSTLTSKLNSIEARYDNLIKDLKGDCEELESENSKLKDEAVAAEFQRREHEAKIQGLSGLLDDERGRNQQLEADLRSRKESSPPATITAAAPHTNDNDELRGILMQCQLAADVRSKTDTDLVGLARDLRDALERVAPAREDMKKLDTAVRSWLKALNIAPPTIATDGGQPILLQRIAAIYDMVSEGIAGSERFTEDQRGMKQTLENAKKRLVYFADTNKRMSDELELKLIELRQVDQLEVQKSRRGALVRSVNATISEVAGTHDLAKSCLEYARAHGSQVETSDLGSVVSGLAGVSNRMTYIYNNFLTEEERLGTVGAAE
eukprot:PhM_4_TR2677/c0_g1_i1/m.26932